MCHLYIIIDHLLKKIYARSSCTGTKVGSAFRYLNYTYMLERSVDRDGCRPDIVLQTGLSDSYSEIHWALFPIERTVGVQPLSGSPPDPLVITTITPWVGEPPGIKCLLRSCVTLTLDRTKLPSVKGPCLNIIFFSRLLDKYMLLAIIFHLNLIGHKLVNSFWEADIIFILRVI